MKKKKKRSNTPRVKKMNRKERLQSAADSWLKSYIGKNYIRGYRKYFGVNVGTAIFELRSLGVSIDDATASQALESEKAAVKAKHARKEERRRRQQEQMESEESWSDDEFAYIAGYTSGGFAYGITWEEMEGILREEVEEVVEEVEEVPFDFDEFMRYHA